MSFGEFDNQHNIEIASRLSFLREILLNQGLTSLGDDSKADLNTARDLNDTRHNCRCGSVISIGSFESLLDTVFVVFSEEKLKSYRQDSLLYTLAERYSDEIKLLKQLYPSKEDFIPKDVIGIGQFGEVRVVQEKNSGEIYAMKTLRKSQLFQLGPSVACFKEERDVMVRAKNSPWVANLAYSFQDSTQLYLIMTFYAGGDLLNVLEQFDPMKECMARFYLSEISTAIHFIHEMGYIHRDVKPENVLVDVSGHIKLADFGSAAGLTEDGRIVGQIPFPVGTPEYVAPEVLSVLEHAVSKSCLYGRECDWWSLGVLAYEMLVGKTPFESGSRIETHANIQNYKKALVFPTEPQLSKEAVGLVVSLCTGITDRIGYYEIIRHEFFNGVDWDDLLNTVPPYIPQVAGPDDVSNFDSCDRSNVSARNCDFELSTGRKKPTSADTDLCFVGYSYLPLVCNSSEEVKYQMDVTSVPVSDPSPAWTDVSELKTLLKHNKRELDMSIEEKELIEKESDIMKEQVQDLRSRLQSEQSERALMEERTLKLLEEVRQGSRRVCEMREADAARRTDREQEAVLKQLTQEKELAMHRARRLEQELMNKNSSWDEQTREVNDLKKKLTHARTEANRCSDKFNKLAEEAHAHLVQKKKEIEMKESALEESEEMLKQNQQKVNETDKQLILELELKEAALSHIAHLTVKVQDLEEAIEQNKVIHTENNDQAVSVQEKERVQVLEQELFDTTRCKEDLESSEFSKDMKLQQTEQELIEVLAEREHVQEELEVLSADMDLKEKEYVTQREVISQLEQELNTARLHIQGYEEDANSRLEYKHKQTVLPTHPDGAQSDTEVMVGTGDNRKAGKSRYSTQLAEIRGDLDKEMKEHVQTREKYFEMNRVAKKKTHDIGRSLEHYKSKLSSNEESHKGKIETLEIRNTELQNQCNKASSKVADMRRVQTSLEREIQQLKNQEVYKEELRSKLSSANLQDNLKQGEKELNRMKGSLTQANKLNKDYEDSVKSLQTELRNLRSNSLRTESQLQQANQQMKADKATLESLRNTISTLECTSTSIQTDAKNTLQTELEEYKSRLTQETQRLCISEQELQDTRRTLQRAENLYQVEIDSWKKLHEEESRKYLSYVDKNRELEVSLRRKEEDIQMLQRKEINIANQMLQLKQQLREAGECENSQLLSQDQSKEHANQLSQELAYEKASKEEAKVRLNELREKNEAQRSEIAALKKKVEEVQESNFQLSSLRAEYRVLKDGELENSKQLNEMKKEIEENSHVRQNFLKLKEEMASLGKELVSKIDEIEELEGKFSRHNRDTESSRDELKKLRVELKEAEQQLSDLRTTTSKHELYSAQWIGEQSKLNDVISGQKNEISKVQTELMRTRDEVKKLKMVVRQLEKGNLNEPERVLDLEDEITEYKTRVQELEEVRDKFNKAIIETENHTRVVNALREDNSSKEIELSKLAEDKQGIEDRNNTLALQLDLQFQEMQKAKDESTCARLQFQQLMATNHKLTIDLENANKQLGNRDDDDALHTKEEKELKESQFRMETQLQQQTKLINYLADGKQDASKWSAKMRKKEFELNKDKLKIPKPARILYPPKTNGSDSGVTSIESDLDRFTPTHHVFDTPNLQQPMSDQYPFTFETQPSNEMECTPLHNDRGHGMLDRVKSTLSGRHTEATIPNIITGSKQLQSKSLKDISIPRFRSDKTLSPVSAVSNTTYSLSSCSESEGNSKRSKELDDADLLTSPPKKICPEFRVPAGRLIPKHFFATKICKSGTMCDACSMPIKFGERKEKCAFCRAVVHPKCSSNYDSICACQSKLPLVNKLDVAANEPQPPCDWFKVLFWPCPKQVWEKFFIILANDALLLYSEQPAIPDRSQATRILKLGPYDKAELTVRSEYVRKRITAFSNLNYACTLALFLQKVPPDSGEMEGAFLQLPSSEKKQEWIDLLTATVRELGRNSDFRDPFIMEPIYSSPSTTNLFFFSALHFKDHNFVLLAEYSGLFVMSMPSFVHPWSAPVQIECSQLIAPIFSLKTFPEMGLVVMIAGRERNIMVTFLEPLIEFICGLLRDKKKTNPKFLTIANTSGCHIIECGKINEVPYMCSFHQDMKGTNNRFLTHYNVPSNYSKCPLQLYNERPLAQCASILATTGKFFIGSHVIISYNPPKKLFRESQISMQNTVINETKTLRNPIEMLVLPQELEYLLVYSDMGVVISRHGGGIYVKEEAIVWNAAPVHAWIDEDILFILSAKNVAIYRLVKGEIPSDPSIYKLNSRGHFLCYIPNNKSMLYTCSEGETTLLYSCKFLFQPIVRSNSKGEIKPVSSAMKRPKTTSLTDLTESVL